MLEKIKSNNHHQPHLLFQGDLQNNDGDFYLFVNGRTMNVGKAFLDAFLIMYKSHWVFNLTYDSSLTKFYNFIEKVIFKRDVRLQSPTSATLFADLERFEATNI